MSKSKISIIGSGGHCRPLLDVLNEKYNNFKKIIYDLDYSNQSKKNEKILNAKVSGSFEDYLKNKKNETYLAIGNNKKRRKIYELIKKKKIVLPNLISETSTRSKYLTIGNSNFINKKAFLGTSVKIGNNNIINSEAVVEHETVIKNHSHIGPKCIIGGRAEIGNEVFLGLGSKVLHRVKICDNCTIGAGTIVNKDINYPGIYVGTPARRVVKERKEICKKKLIVATYGDIGISLLQTLFKEKFKKENILIYSHFNQKNNDRFLSYLDHFKIKYILDNNKVKETIKIFKNFKPDLLISFHFRKKISKTLINIPKYKSINLHPSLLPRYAGCFSSVWAIFNGEKETGISYHIMTNKFDAGDIIFQKKVLIDKTDTAFSLFHKLIDLSLFHLMDVLDLVIDKKFKGYKQDISKRTYYPRKLPNNGIIKKNWSKEVLKRYYRCAYFPPFDIKMKKKNYK